MRDLTTAIALGLPLLALAVGAWATQHPDHPRVAAAREWPLVGHAIARFIPGATPDLGDAIQAASRSAPSETVLQFTRLRAWFEAGTEIHTEPRLDAESVALEVSTRLDIVEQQWGWLRLAGVIDGWTLYAGDPTTLAELPSQHRTAWLRPGDELLDVPDGNVVRTMDRIANLPVVASDVGTWVQVIANDRKLWVEAPDFTGGEPPFGSEPTPLARLAAVPISAERLATARSLLAAHEVEARAGPYPLLGAGPRITSLAAACAPRLASVDARLERHTGLTPVGPARETLLVFGSRESYREFLVEAPRVLNGAGDPDGYALPAQGFAASYFEGRSDAEVCSVLVHEATHLTSRRVLGPALPPWLAEGLATWIEGRPIATTVDAETARSLVRMEEEFYAGDLDRRYRTVAAIVRALLTDRELGPTTRAFLADRAAGRPLPSPHNATAAGIWTSLAAELGSSEAALWQRMQAVHRVRDNDAP